MSPEAGRNTLLAELASAHKHVTDEIVGKIRSSVQGSADLSTIVQDITYWWGQWWQEWNLGVQLAVFATAACTVASAQHINSLGAIYWEEFASQPYFDKNGAFISSVVSCPLILVMLVVLVNCVCTAVLDMIALKRKHMQAVAEQRQKDR